MREQHTYHPGELVERISTGERAYVDASCPNYVSVTLKSDCWPAHDCRPVDHTARDLEMVIAAKDARMAELEAQLAASAEREAALRKLCGDAERDHFRDATKKVEAENQRLRGALERIAAEDDIENFGYTLPAIARAALNGGSNE